jgi:hypothetical protein
MSEKELTVLRLSVLKRSTSPGFFHPLNNFWWLGKQRFAQSFQARRRSQDLAPLRQNVSGLTDHVNPRSVRPVAAMSGSIIPSLDPFQERL